MEKSEYLSAPFVPLGHVPFPRDPNNLPALTPDRFLPLSKTNAPDGIDDPHLLLRCANRVVLRELMMLNKASVVVEWGLDAFWISVTVNDTHLDQWADGCDVREPWDWWPEYKYGKGKRRYADDPDYIEHTLTIARPTDPMNYALTAWNSANIILEAIHSLRTPGAFGAVDVIACVIAAHPATPDSILRRLAVDPQPEVRSFVATNPAASAETAALVQLHG